MTPTNEIIPAMVLEANNVRIFRPNEIARIITSIPKPDDKIRFETLLHTGAHYSEIQRLYGNSNWFKGEHIEIPNQRTIRLSKQGRRVVNQFILCKKGLPHYVTWGENLKRWCSYAKLELDNISVKSTRRTWEAWLVAKYPDKIFHIFQNQGHKELDTLEKYNKLFFSKEDLEEMEDYVTGWL